MEELEELEELETVIERGSHAEGALTGRLKDNAGILLARPLRRPNIEPPSAVFF